MTLQEKDRIKKEYREKFDTLFPLVGLSETGIETAYKLAQEAIEGKRGKVQYSDIVS